MLTGPSQNFCLGVCSSYSTNTLTVYFHDLSTTVSCACTTQDCAKGPVPDQEEHSTKQVDMNQGGILQAGLTS